MPKDHSTNAVLWWTAPYLVALVLVFTRHRAVGVMFAAANLALDPLAHYQFYVQPRIHHRFELTGSLVYLIPAPSLFAVGPLTALIMWVRNGRAMKRQGLRTPEERAANAHRHRAARTRE